MHSVIRVPVASFPGSLHKGRGEPGNEPRLPVLNGGHNIAV